MEVAKNVLTDREFENAFRTHYKALHGYAYSILNNTEDAEERVQHVFFKLWEKRENLSISQSLQAYLYRAVYNDCMNFIKHEKVKQVHQSYVMHANKEGAFSNDFAEKELENRIALALNKLPEQCRTIFQMSRFEELKYKEIADKMSLSIKTIENQMGKALKIMRAELADYLTIALFIIVHFLFY